MHRPSSALALLLPILLTATGVGAQDGRSAQILAAEASGLMQAARIVRDGRDRGHIAYLAQLKLERIKTAFPQSVVAAELAFGRYEDIDAASVEREARAWSLANAAEAEALRRSDRSVASGAAASSLVPNFGRPAGGGIAVASPATPVVEPSAVAGRALGTGELTQRLRESVVFIHVPGRNEGSGFFISPTHILTNTHVVQGVDRVVVANKTMGIRAARVLALGRINNIGPDTAVLQIEGAPGPGHLPLAPGVAEGDSIAVGGYPGKAAVGIDKAYMNFSRLISQNRLPTSENIPNVKFDFGFLQSIFTNNASGIETIQIGVMVAPGSSGSPVLNRCGEVVGQVQSVTTTRLNIQRGTEGFVATGEAMTFSFGISVKELTKFLASTSATHTIARSSCAPT